MDSFIIPILLMQYAMGKNESIKDINERNVFIVEDDEMHSLMMEYLLSNETTAHIKKFRSGEECIKNLNLDPDVVILDYGLPGISGIQTLMGIKKYAPNIPVIVVTGNRDKNIAKQFLTAGVYDYIQKDDKSFEQVSKLTESVLGIMTQKEYRKHHRKNVITAGIFLLATAIIILVYLITK